MKLVDLRSDTVTQPSAAMREAMAIAPVGDDVYGEDPTVRALEERVASLFCKESALFFPTGTMSNLAAIMAWCQGRGGEIIVGDNSHIFLFEQAGAAQFGGISPRTVPNLMDGTMDLDAVRLSIRDDDIHEPVTKLICIENTHNACGGKVLPLTFMQYLKEVANSRSIPVHLDGARVWNAITAMEVEPCEMAMDVDSLSVCLSKGLGAPAGSLLVGPADFIKRARRIRKALGGGMRQVGVLAAAGMIALDDFEAGILELDHRKVIRLATAIRRLHAFSLWEPVETNILFLDIIAHNEYRDRVVEMMKARGVLVSMWSPRLLRLVIHRDIDDTDIENTITALTEVSTILTAFN